MDTNHLQEQAHMTEIDLADCRQGFVFREQTPQGGNIPVGRHKQVIKTALQEGYAKGIISQCAGGVYKAEHPTVCADVLTLQHELETEHIRITVRAEFMGRLGDEAQSLVQDWVRLEIEQILIAVSAELMVRVGDG